MQLQKKGFSIVIVAVMFCSLNNVFAQEPESLVDKIFSFPAKAQYAIDKKIKNIDDAFEKTIDKQIAKLQKQENRIYRKLRRKDSAAANNYLLQSKQSIATLKDKLANPGKYTQYIPLLRYTKNLLPVFKPAGQTGEPDKTSRAKNRNFS
ncbi:MAG: hypothetical protein IPP72_13730 [Chitinophagaceae bacterium]|nr:hypothetical protein [Chitinophagaceae bacterium]